ncbi:MAG: hypothetical protein GTN93_34320 [Anaerolineae bacterium]|nr:hypothetical protein [Anaerolineae bacterium]
MPEMEQTGPAIVTPPAEQPAPQSPLEQAKQAAEEPDMEKALEELKDALIKEGEKQGLPKEQIDAWKEQYGRIGAFPIGEDIYFIRPLSRHEWRELNKQQAERNSDGADPLSELDLEEKITLMATLHPRFDESRFRHASMAGIATTVAQAVHNMSGFMPGVQAIVL